MGGDGDMGDELKIVIAMLNLLPHQGVPPPTSPLLIVLDPGQSKVKISSKAKVAHMIGAPCRVKLFYVVGGKHKIQKASYSIDTSGAYSRSEI